MAPARASRTLSGGFDAPDRCREKFHIIPSRVRLRVAAFRGFMGPSVAKAPVGTECGRKEATSDANLHQSGLFDWLHQGTANGGIQREDQMTLLFNMKSSFPG